MDECVARRNVQPLYHLQLLFFRDSKFPGPPSGRPEDVAAFTDVKHFINKMRVAHLLPWQLYSP
jgi:hypothetical protein